MPSVPVAELVANPSRYHGQEVCTVGMCVQGFEVSALGVDTQEKDGLTYLTGPLVWIEGAEITSRGPCFSQGDNLYAQHTEFCQVTICGRFEHCHKCGQLDGYAFQLTNPGASKPTLRDDEALAERTDMTCL
jgi:hypothetical protein